MVTLAAGCGQQSATSVARPPVGLPVPPPPAPTWRAVSVHDVDTLRAIDQANVQHKIRLVSIDAPELGEPFGRVARDRLGELTVGRMVAVQLRDRDRYGRAGTSPTWRSRGQPEPASGRRGACG